MGSLSGNRNTVHFWLFGNVNDLFTVSEIVEHSKFQKRPNSWHASECPGGKSDKSVSALEKWNSQEPFAFRATCPESVISVRRTNGQLGRRWLESLSCRAQAEARTYEEGRDAVQD